MKKNIFKSHWYYWHTGHKSIAIISMLISTIIMWFLLVLSAGFSIWGIIIAVLLDAIGFWLAIIYIFALRNYVPHVLSLQDKADGLVVNQLILPLVISILITRISTFIVAKTFRY